MALAALFQWQFVNKEALVKRFDQLADPRSALRRLT
jgi:hypothetical protein